MSTKIPAHRCIENGAFNPPHPRSSHEIITLLNANAREEAGFLSYISLSPLGWWVRGLFCSASACNCRHTAYLQFIQDESSFRINYNIRWEVAINCTYRGRYWWIKLAGPLSWCIGDNSWADYLQIYFIQCFPCLVCDAIFALQFSI